MTSLADLKIKIKKVYDDTSNAFNQGVSNFKGNVQAFSDPKTRVDWMRGTADTIAKTPINLGSLNKPVNDFVARTAPLVRNPQRLLTEGIMSSKARAVPIFKSIGKSLGNEQAGEDVGYGVRGALSLTPFQAKPLGIGPTVKSVQKLEQATAPLTLRQKLAQSVGQSTYGTLLSAPLAKGKTVLKTVGNITRNAGVGTATGTLMRIGNDALEGKMPTKESVTEGAMSGLQNSWVLPITNSLTDKAILKFIPKAAKYTGEFASAPFKTGQIKEGFRRLLVQSLAQVPAENTAFTFLNQLDDNAKGSFVHNWVNNLPGAIAGNILSAGVAGTTGTLVNKASRDEIGKAMSKTVSEWNRPVSFMGGPKVPYWKYAMGAYPFPSNYKVRYESSIDTPNLKVVDAVTGKEIPMDKNGKIQLSNGKIKIKTMDPTVASNIAEQKKITLKINKGQEAIRRGGWGSNKFSPEEIDMVRRGLDDNTAKLKKSVLGKLPENSAEAKAKVTTLTQEYEQAQMEAEQANTLRSMFSNDGIRDVAQLKFLGSRILANGGDMESVRAKYPDLVERVTQAVREAEPNIKYDEEAFQYALDLPTKAATLASKPTDLKALQDSLQSLDKFQEFGLKVQTGAGGKPVAVNAEPTLKTTAEIMAKGKKADAKTDEYDYEQWQKSVFGDTKAKGGISNPLNVLTKAVKNETNANASGLNFSDDWKGKSRLSFARETMTRNFEDVMGKDAPEMKKKYLDPIAHSEAERTRWLNKERGEVEALGIKPRSKESALVQDYGEGIIGEVELRTMTNDPAKIIKAADFLRNKYDGYIKELNTTLVRNGYDPVPFRKDYFHHFNDLTLNLEVLGPWKKIGEALKAEELPTDINGLTADFKPGRQFFNAILQRKGETRTPDAIQGIDKYLEGASNQIFHTDNIKRLRSLEDEIRAKYAGDDHLTNFAADLGEFTNNLAGKKAMFDRGFESWFGRPVYTVLNAIKSQVGANMVGGNIASALTNYIPLTQTLATTSKGAVVKAMGDTLKNVARDDGFVNSSDFLTRRLGSDKLTTTKWEDLGKKAGWLFQIVDKFTSQVVVRSKYLEGIDNGMAPVDAMKSANDWAAKIMADRSKGATPTMFNSKAMGALTQFQLEVNNQISFLTKDIPRNSETWGKAASQIAQLFLYGYLFNNLTQAITGRRPALDPIGVTQQAYEDFTNPDMKEGRAMSNLVSNVSDQLPFTSIVTGGGRIPMTAAIPDIPKLITGDTTWGKEAKKLGYLLPPFGGGQAMKTYDGLKAYLQGYSETPSGAVRFPVPQTPFNAIKTGLFGQWSTPEAQKYLREGQTPMGANQSELIKQSDDKVGLFNVIKKVSASSANDDKIKEQVKKDGSAQFTDSKLFWYNPESGETNTINYGKYLAPAPTDPVQKARWEQDKFSAAMKMYRAEGIDPTAKQDTFNKLGINETDLAYFDIASDDVNIKRVFIGEYLNTLDPTKDKMTALAELRRTVKAQAILSDNVITAMVKNGELTAQEGKLLKRIDWDEQTNEPKISKSGSGKISIKSVKFTPTKSSAPARMATPQISMNTGSRIKLMEPGKSSTKRMIKLRRLPTSKLKIKSTYYQGAQK